MQQPSAFPADGMSNIWAYLTGRANTIVNCDESKRETKSEALRIKGLAETSALIANCGLGT
jgi:hypothetical protein